MAGMLGDDERVERLALLPHPRGMLASEGRGSVMSPGIQWGDWIAPQWLASMVGTGNRIATGDMDERDALNVALGMMGGGMGATRPGLGMGGREAKGMLPLSKIVDAEGNPRRVYHGTQADFTDFAPTGVKVKRQTTDPNRLLGTHFSEQPSVASGFAEGRYTGKTEGGRVIPAYLDIKNPAVFSLESDLNGAMVRFAYDTKRVSADDIAKFADAESAHYLRSGRYDAMNDRDKENFWYSIGSSVMKRAPQRAAVAKAFKKNLQERGFDGITYGNSVEGYFGNPAHIAFEPEQIINAISPTIKGK